VQRRIHSYLEGWDVGGLILPIGDHPAGGFRTTLFGLVEIGWWIGHSRPPNLRRPDQSRKYLPGEAYQQVEYNREADYIFRALAAFFLEVATFQPVCLSFEDLQWADKSSLDLLRHLAAALAGTRRAADGPRVVPRLVIVASARTDYASLEGLLAQFRDQRHLLELHLAHMTELETRELIALRLNGRPEELADELVGCIHALCRGNPFFIAETVREWYEKQAITRGESGWVLKTEAADSTDVPETVRDVLRLRIQGLPPMAQQVLGAASVIGALVEIDLLNEVLHDLSESDVLDAIDVMIPRRVFRETDNAGRVEFVHDLLREMTYAELSASRRRSLHRRVGELLERRREEGCPVAPSVLAGHFKYADEREKVFTYSFEAGEEAIRAYAFEDALLFLEQAKLLIPELTPPEQRYRLWSLLGKANCSSKRTEAAIASYRAATELAPNRALHASALVGIGEAHQRAGSHQQAKMAFEQALHRAGYWSSSRFINLFTSLIFMMVPTAIRRKTGDPISRQTRDVAFSATEQLALNTLTRNALEYKLHVLRMLGLARSTGDLDQLAAAYSRFAMTLASIGFGGMALRFVPRAEENAARCESQALKESVYSYIRIIYGWSGRTIRAIEVIEDAQAKLEKYAHWSFPTVTHYLQRLYARLGDTAKELAICAKEIAFGEQTSNAMACAWGEYGTANAMARSGRIREVEGRPLVSGSRRSCRAPRNPLRPCPCPGRCLARDTREGRRVPASRASTARPARRRRARSRAIAPDELSIRRLSAFAHP
jgi:predicted ATPase